MIDLRAKKRFEKFTEGFSITSAIIYNKSRMAFVMKASANEATLLMGDDELETRFFLYNPNIKLEKFGVVINFWAKGVMRAWPVFKGSEKESIILCSNRAASCEYESDLKIDKWYPWKQLPLPQNRDVAMLRGIRGCKNIGGEVYMFGRFRKLYKRIGLQQWNDESYENKHPNLHVDLEQYKKKGVKLMSVGIGFNDIDGFSTEDI